MTAAIGEGSPERTGEREQVERKERRASSSDQARPSETGRQPARGRPKEGSAQPGREGPATPTTDHLDVDRYHAALRMSLAKNSQKSLKARLATWDRSAARLRSWGLLGPSAGEGRLTAGEIRRVPAYLRAQGYRSAHLYVSAAVQRHKEQHQLEAQLAFAAHEAQRAAKRGIGPPEGKWPCPLPEQGSPFYAPLLVT